MVDSTGGKKPPGKKGKKKPGKAEGASKGSGGKTVKLAQKLALAVIQEYGLPQEIKDALHKALEPYDVDPNIIERVGGYWDDHPHGAYGYTRKKKK